MERNKLDIETPEGITFSLTLASPVTRALAWLIDVVCTTVLINVVILLLLLVGLLSPQIAIGSMMVAVFLIQSGYPMVLEWLWRGQTLGKRLMHIRVMDEQGLHLDFSQVVIRNLLRYVDALPLAYLLGGITCLINSRGQRLGDLAANTIVVRETKPEEPDLDKLLAGKYNSLRAYPHLTGRLRQRVSPEEARVALQALVRRDELDADARVQLYSRIADHLRTLITFPEEATFGLTDEHYLRNVVDVLFRPKGPSAAPAEDDVKAAQEAAALGGMPAPPKSPPAMEPDVQRAAGETPVSEASAVEASTVEAPVVAPMPEAAPLEKGETQPAPASDALPDEDRDWCLPEDKE